MYMIAVESDDGGNLIIAEATRYSRYNETDQLQNYSQSLIIWKAQYLSPTMSKLGSIVAP